MVDVRGNDRASACDFFAYELGRHIRRNRSAKRLAAMLMQKRIARRITGKIPRSLAPHVFANRNKLHLRSNYPAARVVKLRNTRASVRAQDRAPQGRKI